MKNNVQILFSNPKICQHIISWHFQEHMFFKSGATVKLM